MLNISPYRVNEEVVPERYDSLRRAEARVSNNVFPRLLLGSAILFLVCMFLPWTQNVRAYGKVTTIDPGQRPQTVPAIIAGRIEQWHVREGDFVERGDTILRLSEIKSEYLDPELVQRTEQQLRAKELSEQSYRAKAGAAESRIAALRRAAEIKTQQATNKLAQARLKVISDSIDLEAAGLQESIALTQVERMEELYRDGLKSLTDLEKRRLKAQETAAKRISAQNKLLASRNEVLNAVAEIDAIAAKLADDVAKAQSERLSGLSDAFAANAEASKLANQVSNYSLRQGLYFVTAPQAGYVTQALQTGLGETVKEGDRLVSIVPVDYELAVEAYVDPIDLPLLARGQEVNIQFEGWPSIVFSGWPGTSYGTFLGDIRAIDNVASAGGKYRILVAQSTVEPWPDALRVGAGANSFILLEDVPVYYELWRKLNAFPPNLPEEAASQPGLKKAKK